jgi:hypothetical protein
MISKAWLGKAIQGLARQSKACLGNTNVVREGKVRLGKAMRG